MEGYFKNPYTVFLEESMFFLLVLDKLYDKTNSHFAVKFAGCVNIDQKKVKAGKIFFLSTSTV